MRESVRMRCLSRSFPVGVLLVLFAAACPAAATPTGGTAAGPFVTGTPEGGAPAPPAVTEPPRAMAAQQEEEPELGAPTPDEEQPQDDSSPIDVSVPQSELDGGETSEVAAVDDSDGGLASTGFEPLLLAGGGLLLLVAGLATRRSSAAARGGAG